MIPEVSILKDPVKVSYGASHQREAALPKNDGSNSDDGEQPGVSNGTVPGQKGGKEFGKEEGESQQEPADGFERSDSGYVQYR